MISSHKFHLYIGQYHNKLVISRMLFFLGHSTVCNNSVIAMCLLTVKIEMVFTKDVKKNVPEITNLLQYWWMLEISGGKN